MANSALKTPTPKKERRLGEIAWVLSGQGAALVGGLVGLKLLTNLLSEETFGSFQLWWSVALIAATSAFGPLGQAVIRLSPNAVSSGFGNRLFRQSIGFVLGLSGATVIVIAILAFGIGLRDPLLIGAGAIMAAAHGSTVFFQHYQSALRNRRSYAVIAGATGFGRPLTAAAVVIAAGTAFGNLASAVVGAALFLLGIALIQWTLVRRSIARTVPMRPVDTATPYRPRELLAISAPMAMVGALTVISLYADRWIVEQRLDLAAVGIYAAIYQLATAPIQFTQGVLNRFSLPIIFADFGDGKTAGQLAKTRRNLRVLIVAWVTTIVVIALFGALFHRAIVSLITTEMIADFSVLLPMLIFGLGLERSAQILSVIGNIDKKFGTYVIARLIHIAVFITAAFALVDYYGIFAFAIAHILAGLAILCATLFINHKLLNRAQGGFNRS